MNRTPLFPKRGWLLLLGLLLPACDFKWPENGYLDGQWQLLEIESDSEATIRPQQTYYAVQLNLIQLRRTGVSTLTGYLRRTGDSLAIDIREGDTLLLPQFGLPAAQSRFRIERLTERRLTLSDRERRLRFRKF